MRKRNGIYELVKDKQVKDELVKAEQVKDELVKHDQVNN